MGRVFRIKLALRRFSRRHPWLIFGLRSFMVFSAAFGGAYGFITGSRSDSSGYNPHLFAIGASFLFANLPDRFLSVHLRHPQVHADQIVFPMALKCEHNRIHSLLPI